MKTLFSKNRIVTSLLLSQMCLASSHALAEGGKLVEYPEFQREHRAYATANTIVTGALGATLGAFIGVLSKAPSPANGLSHILIPAAILGLAGAATAESAPNDSPTAYIRSIKKTKDYQVLVAKLGDQRANQFLRDLVTVFEENKSDASLRELGARYPEIFGTAKAEEIESSLSKRAINARVRKLTEDGDLTSIDSTLPREANVGSAK